MTLREFTEAVAAYDGLVAAPVAIADLVEIYNDIKPRLTALQQLDVIDRGDYVEVTIIIKDREARRETRKITVQSA